MYLKFLMYLIYLDKLQMAILLFLGRINSTFWDLNSTFWDLNSTFWDLISTFWDLISTFWDLIST